MFLKRILQLRIEQEYRVYHTGKQNDRRLFVSIPRTVEYCRYCRAWSYILCSRGDYSTHRDLLVFSICLAEKCNLFLSICNQLR